MTSTDRDLRSVWIVAGTSGGPPGGMKRHVSLHARGLEQAGVHARLLYTEDALSAPRALAARMPGAFLLAAQLRQVRAEPPDVVNVHTLSAPAWISARQLGICRAKVVVMSYGSDERAMPSPRTFGDRLRRWRISVPARSLFPRASGVWCVNSEDAAYYEQEYRVPRDRIAVLPHAIEDGFFERGPTTARDWNRLLFVGTPIHRKGIDVLLGALAAVLDRRPEATAVLAGTLSDCRAELAHLSEPIRRRIQVHPILDDQGLRRMYQECGLILIPSRFEGLPFSILEAMACGCPALAAANSGMLDVLRDGDNGWLQRGFDLGQWAERICSILSDGPTQQRVSASARVHAESYRLDALTRRALDWYRSL